ncbi:MAG: amidohydrolase family protein [Spirochaetaceae bacterium]|jgi:N-acyl-D-amino-acid deacylase|nr:amidohydrolase family protein [Spirochaetaceae bacterium]
MLDYLITNAKIADGAGIKENISVLGIKNGSIAYLGAQNDVPPQTKQTLDVCGALLTPGVIDVHAHSDSNISCAENLLAQGVTTCLSGNCGLSPQIDFTLCRSKFEEQGYPINQAEQIGHSSLRLAVGVNNFYAAANSAQIKAMQELTRKAFDYGAAGLSFGLEYDPGSTKDEVITLAKTAVSCCKNHFPPLVTIHARNVDKSNDASILEAVNIAEETGARLIISHLVYMWNGDGLKRTIDIIAAARKRGLDVWADSGMWTAYSTTCGSAVFDEQEFIRKGYDFNKVLAATGKYAGKFLNLEQYREIRNNSPKDCFIYDPGSASDIWTAFSLEDVMVSTDAAPNKEGQGHPQNIATFPYFFRVMAKGGALNTNAAKNTEADSSAAFAPYQFSICEALRRTSLLPAKALNLTQKGLIKIGMDADIAVFNWNELCEKASFPGIGDPNKPNIGVMHVFVNGVLSWTNQKRIKGVMAGKWL